MGRDWDSSSEEYKNALAQNLRQIELLQIEGFKTIQFFAEMDKESLKTSGFSSNEEAVIYVYKDTKKNILKLTREFLKKYPD